MREYMMCVNIPFLPPSLYAALTSFSSAIVSVCAGWCREALVRRPTDYASFCFDCEREVHSGTALFEVSLWRRLVPQLPAPVPPRTMRDARSPSALHALYKKCTPQDACESSAGTIVHIASDACESSSFSKAQRWHGAGTRRGASSY
jgi:hypothetical protein